MAGKARGEIEPEDVSGDLLVQLGTATEPLNSQWYEKNTGQVGRGITMQSMLSAFARPAYEDERQVRHRRR